MLALVGKAGSGILRSLYQAIGGDGDLAKKVTVPLDGIEKRQAAHVVGLIRDPDGADYLDRVDLIGRTHASASRWRPSCMSLAMRPFWRKWSKASAR